MDRPGRALGEVEPQTVQNFREDPLSLHCLNDGEKSPNGLQSPSVTTSTTPTASSTSNAEPHPDRAPTPPPAATKMSSLAGASFEREASPPLTLSPTLAMDAVPQLDRSVSTASSMSSRRSSSSRLSDPGLTSTKRRGYMRPQVTTYSESAKNRESVMSLGSIAHLQYYFARTGLLDGKGAQIARPEMLRRKSSNIGSGSNSRAVSTSATVHADTPGAYSQSGLLSPTMAASASDSCAISDAGLTDSPIDQEAEIDWESEMMLPPTVSTYNQKPIYVPPPPDLTMLRRELTEALEDALKVLKETDKSPDDTEGWHEIQGVHLLDVITLAIRAARNYYTAHTKPQRLYQFKSEKDIRNDLYKTLEILKRMASRNFAGGIRQGEKVEILTWIVGISELIQSEIDEEKREQEEREKLCWRTGDWTGREREREELFLRSFMERPEEMPIWTDPADAGDANLPTPFLRFFHDGLRLVQLHNELVRKSRRNFEEIRIFHTDTAKPYRMAENLRYWIKAAQLRWDVRLNMDVMAVVHGEDPAAWREFDETILRWCQRVREEIMTEWEGKLSPTRRTPPTLKVEPQTPERPRTANLEVPAAELTPVA
ncbi:uncharacterized protein PV09_03383 [Verruconis gallopava]|uniref:Calponin-homology (CH) domain-containing protein n=1 Tax=Verruconis gallopava TaxID=253628 RepID=A0A0D2AG80_9PEZI|nr:uncharacterized protein PV09_03383 [Verruconis gallopava]KIW05500.1 hypothetical protein PV09_03383 [Verruconis gallopava]